MNEDQVNILLVEDNPGDARLIREMLLEPGGLYFHLEWRESLSEGLELLDLGGVDLLILDLSLPDSQGIETFRRVALSTREIPVIIMTGYDDREFGAKAVREGAQDFLVKDRVDGSLLASSIRYSIERKLAQKALEESREHFRFIVENTTDVVAIFSPAGTIEFISPSVEVITGMPAEEFHGARIYDHVHPDDYVQVAGLVEESAGSPAKLNTAEFRVRARDGRWRHAEAHSRVLAGGTCGTRIMASIRDITERKLAEQELITAKEWWEKSFEAVGEGMFILDKDMTIIQCNNALSRILGTGREHLIGRKCHEVVHGKPGPPDFCVVVAATRLGRSAMAEIYEPFCDSYLGVTADLIWQASELSGAIHIIRDITGQKVAEKNLQKINRELETFAHTVSHDLKGPISCIMLSTRLIRLLTGEPESSGKQADLEKALDLTDRSATTSIDLINSLLSLAESGQVPDQLCRVNTADVVRQVLEERAAVIRERGVKVDAGGDLGEVDASPVHIYQLFANLIDNAIKHNCGSGLEIRIAYLGHDGNRHHYLVRDNGTGIPPEFLESIFIPFFKGSRNGSGIGLSTVERIAEVYDGKVSVWNDNGACFRFSLGAPRPKTLP